MTTPRLLLRAANEADIPELHRKIFGVPEVMEWVLAGKTLSAADCENFVRANFIFTPAPIGLAVLTDRTCGAVVGFAGLIPCSVLAADDLEIGVALAKDAWGRGFATEVARAQLALGFEQLGRPRMLGLAAEQNVASVHTIEKLGMPFHCEVQPPGRSLRRLYCMTAEQWRHGQSE